MIPKASRSRLRLPGHHFLRKRLPRPDEMGDVFLVYARTGEKSSDISLFLIEKGTPGFSVGQRIKDKCGACVCHHIS